MKYLTVGTREITQELFRNVEDTEPNNIKPRGGLWLTKYHSEFYNEWVDFILDDPVILFYKNRQNSIWEQPCSLVTLNDSAKIFCLDSKQNLDYLRCTYPLDNDKFSYQAISNIYDGIYVDMYHLLCDIDDDETRKKIFKFGVNSLILFNLSCIDYYHPGTVYIEPFDYEAREYEAISYEIKCDDVKTRILKK